VLLEFLILVKSDVGVVHELQWALPIGVLLAALVYLAINYLCHRIPRDVPRDSRLRASVRGIEVGRPFLDHVFRRKSAPLFLVGKDLEHTYALQEAPTTLPETWSLKSLKYASGDDLHRLCELAHSFTEIERGRDRSADVYSALKQYVIGGTGVAAVEGKIRWEGRTVICVGGGDTNPFSGDIVRKYSRFWGGYPPLRFTLSTSEVILAATLKTHEAFWENENPNQEMDRTGILFCCNEPVRFLARWYRAMRRRRGGENTERRAYPIQVILAGLHREGTRASCRVLDYYVRRNQDQLKAEGILPSYIYAKRLLWGELPWAITRLQKKENDAANEDALIVLQDKKRLSFRKERGAEERSCEPDRGGDRDLCIVLGRAVRDYRDENKRREHRPYAQHLQLSGACRVIDFVTRYTLWNGSNMKIGDDRNWRNEAGDLDGTTILSKLSEYKETLFVGTREQNSVLDKILGHSSCDQLKDAYDRLRRFIKEEVSVQNPVGGFVIGRPDGTTTTMAIALGIGENPKDLYGDELLPNITNCVAIATQAAIIGMLAELEKKRDSDAVAPADMKLDLLSPGVYTCRVKRAFTARRVLFPVDKNIEVTGPR